MQFPEFSNNARAEERKKEQEKICDVKFVITYNHLSLPKINKIIKNIFSILQTDEDTKKFLHLTLSLPYAEKFFYLLPYITLNLTKIKVQSVVVKNVISVRIIL